MAYPFAPGLRLRDIIERLRREGGDSLRIEEIRMIGPRGETSAKILVRISDSRVFIAYLPEVDDADVMIPDVARSLLMQLGLNPSEYGYHLSSTTDEDDDDEDGKPS